MRGPTATSETWKRVNAFIHHSRPWRMRVEAHSSYPVSLSKHRIVCPVIGHFQGPPLGLVLRREQRQDVGVYKNKVDQSL